jgi:signal transduction histidine kinase
VVFTDRVGWGVFVSGDEDRLTQVFVNLLRNAVDAVGGRGLIRVEAVEVERWGGRYLSVTVSDDGPGIAREVMDRLFEPFATTNLDAEGTGLGLAVSEGIVREHGGAIRARNNERPRRGATFEVLLPLEAGAGDGGGGTASGLG